MNRPYVTDTESGIRTLTQIQKLPVSELTDDEIVKLFFRRFNANALVFAYVDKQGDYQVFGRARRIRKHWFWMGRLMANLKIRLEKARMNLKFLEEM